MVKVIKRIYQIAGKIQRRLFLYLELFSYKILPHCRDLIDVFTSVSSRYRLRKEPVKGLGIIDFTSIPFGLGDAIIFQENLCILKEKYKLEQIDMCLVDDPDPFRARSSVYNWRSDNQSAKKKILIRQTISLNPYIGNVFIFNNYEDYNHFRMDHLYEYVHFPNRRDQLPSDIRPINQFYRSSGYLPKLKADEISLNWAEKIIETHIRPAKLLVIQIRNLASAKIRNSDLNAWEKFIENLDNSQFRVICIGLEEEIVLSWRKRDLVLFSKDLGADLLKDCALIQLAYACLLPPSGMFAFALFTGTPFVEFNAPKGYHEKKGKAIFSLNMDIKDSQQFIFQSPFQEIVWEKDTYEIIDYHFKELILKLENTSINKKAIKSNNKRIDE